ncbi:sucrase ferredoxin [Nocardioides sp. MAHUQ-72]|uniref:sucrase ferredoxin n=1 Tax=unclassified Nocardioides TaxID=2615069 RepID=UPI0036071340
MTGGAPAPGDPDFRCAAASLLRDESVAGTASTVRAFLLLEHPGPWGVDALRDARLPDGLGERLRAAAAEAGVRVLLVRRPGARPGVARPWVFAAFAHPHRPRLEGARVDDLGEVLDLDLAGLRTGRPSGLTAYDGSLLCVCTHGRHDACCAERGRPLARSLAQAHPEETWEVSHIGGDRFAGNLLVLPHGLYYGRLEPQSALAVAGAHLSGELDLDHLRGRSGLPMAVQHAEIALRRDLAETRLDALTLTARSGADGVTEAVFDVAGASYAVRVRTTRGPEQARLTCRAGRDNPLPHHELLGIERR